MNNVKTFFKGIYEINKNEYWLVCFLNLAFSATFYFFAVNEVIQGFVIFLLFLKTASFVRSANIMPSISSDFDRFSWKYFQGIPLNKKEIVFSLLIVDMFVMSSLLIWGQAFFYQLSNLFFEKEKYDLLLALQFLIFFFPVTAFISAISITNQIVYPRRQYSKNDPKIVFYNFVKSGLVWLVALGYGSFIIAVAVSELNLTIPSFVGTFFKVFYKNMTSWWALLPLCAIALAHVKNVFTVWQNEKKGYVKYNWNPKKDFSIVGLCFSLLVIPLGLTDIHTPREYEGPFQKSVYTKNWKEISKFSEYKDEINKPNSYGLTPLHVAVLTKNFKAYEYLLEKGADPSLPVKSEKISKYKELDVMRLAILSGSTEVMDHLLKNKYHVERIVSQFLNTPLHFAASKCQAQMVDKLIQAGANVNAVNKVGSTPLHFAAAGKCFGVVTSLIDAGADPKIKNKDQKVALDVLMKKISTKDKELAYYLEKKTRSPASIEK